MAVGVDEACFDDGIEAGAFFIGETGVLSVLFRAREIDFLVSDIEVATEEDGLFGFLKGVYVGEEIFVPLHPVVEAAELVLRVWSVDGDEAIGWKFESDDAAFAIVFLDSHTEGDVFGFLFCENRGARVAGLFGRVPVGMIAAKFEREIYLFGASFRFLEAENVRLFLCDEIGETFLDDCADAVDVPGEEFHWEEGKRKQPRIKETRLEVLVEVGRADFIV